MDSSVDLGSGLCRQGAMDDEVGDERGMEAGGREPFGWVAIYTQ